MREGLFAFHNEVLHFHAFVAGDPPLDHAGWFEQIGLPAHGPGFDALLRGRVTLDLDTDRVVVGVYGAAYLSNHRFRKVVEAFQLDEGRVVEKRLSDGR